MRHAARTASTPETEASAESAVHTSTPHNGNGSRTSGSGRVTKAQLNVLVALGVIAFLYFARQVILPVVIGYVGAMVLKPAVVWLTRWHIPKAVGGLLILGIFFGAIAVGFVQFSQPALKWINNAPQNVATLRERAEKMFPTEKFQKAADALTTMGGAAITNNSVYTNATTNATARVNNQSQAPTPAASAPAPASGSHGEAATKALSWTGGFLGGILETVVLLYMFLILGDEYLDQIFSGASSAQEKKRLMKISREVQTTISQYLFTVSIINLALGILVGAGLEIMGFPNGALWGLVAFLLNFVPYFGPIIGVAIVALVGLLTGDSLAVQILGPCWYLLLHICEADFLTPVFLGRQFTISPVAIFITLLFWVWLWGPLGALLAMPIIISVKVICRDIPSLNAANRFL